MKQESCSFIMKSYKFILKIREYSFLQGRDESAVSSMIGSHSRYTFQTARVPSKLNTPRVMFQKFYGPSQVLNDNTCL